MTTWDSDTVRRLTQVANDLTALSATLEVVRSRRPNDAAVVGAISFVERMIGNVDAIVSRLRDG